VVVVFSIGHGFNHIAGIQLSPKDVGLTLPPCWGESDVTSKNQMGEVLKTIRKITTFSNEVDILLMEGT